MKQLPHFKMSYEDAKKALHNNIAEEMSNIQDKYEENNANNYWWAFLMIFTFVVGIMMIHSGIKGIANDAFHAGQQNVRDSIGTCVRGK